MSCCQCQGIEKEFNNKYATKNFKSYNKKGPFKLTKKLISAIEEIGVKGKTLLDIGAGVGAIQLELFKSGLKQSTDVDASSAFLDKAKQLAEINGLEKSIEFLHGDFSDLEDKIKEADIVTLDKVICCYDDMESLVKLSAAKAKSLYGVIYPRDNWLAKLSFSFSNIYLWITRSPMRVFVHNNVTVNSIITESGLKLKEHFTGYIWQVSLYSK